MQTNMSNMSSCVQQLIDNPAEVFLDTSELLLKFANNILNNPDNPKYRRIRVANPTVQGRLLAVAGAVDCLFGMGFQEDGEFFTFPQGCRMDDLTQIKKELIAQREKVLVAAKSQRVQPQVAQPTMHGSQASIRESTVAQPTSQNNIGAVIRERSLPFVESEVLFFRKLKASFDHVLIYEDLRVQAKARSCIPVTKLRQKAEEKQKEFAHQKVKPDISELLLLELLAWFKHQFFSWVDAPKCCRCAGNTTSAGMVSPTQQELMWGANRVENYYCAGCQASTRFPRYNHPEKLLETRCGRCGEWANCFTLCCRAMGFEARYVLDWTDHVWTEVYCESEKRWLHCDPCENTCDKPLIYESGWSKKLSYVVAFAKDDIQDVTWRYTTKQNEVLSRRKECREAWLLRVINKLREQRQKNLPDPRKKELMDRMVCELVEFLNVKSASADEMVGRSTGSLAWRQARGELGSTGPEPKALIIKPTAAETQIKVIHLQYNCASNKYVRVSDKSSEVHGWQEMVFAAENIHRKEELDWGMVYLARQEGTAMATVVWKFDVHESGLSLDKVEIMAASQCYEDGQVTWRLRSDSHSATLPQGGRATLGDLRGQTLTLTATLTQGKGDVAWQHTQLFRQNIDDRSIFPLDIKIYLKPV